MALLLTWKETHAATSAEGDRAAAVLYSFFDRWANALQNTLVTRKKMKFQPVPAAQSA
jgi:hypothetical protein